MGFPVKKRINVLNLECESMTAIAYRFQTKRQNPKEVGIANGNNAPPPCASTQAYSNFTYMGNNIVCFILLRLPKREQPQQENFLQHRYLIQYI